MKDPTRASHSYAVRGLLAAAVLYYALHLSSSGRGWIDYLVISLVSLAITYNVVQLARRMYALSGSRGVWHVARTVLFWVLGAGYVIWLSTAKNN